MLKSRAYSNLKDIQPGDGLELRADDRKHPRHTGHTRDKGDQPYLGRQQSHYLYGKEDMALRLLHWGILSANGVRLEWCEGPVVISLEDFDEEEEECKKGPKYER